MSGLFGEGVDVLRTGAESPPSSDFSERGLWSLSTDNKRRAGVLRSATGQPQSLTWFHVECCSSTQDVARTLWEQGSALACAVTTDRQTQGRGTWGRTWLSEEGNLMLSIALAAPAEVAQMPLQVARVVQGWLQRLGGRVVIQGVNDLVLEGVWPRARTSGVAFGQGQRGKVCGILIEAWEGCRGPAITVGIGVNCAVAPSIEAAGQPTTSLQAHGLECSAETAAHGLLPVLFASWGLPCAVPHEPTQLSWEPGL